MTEGISPIENQDWFSEEKTIQQKEEPFIKRFEEAESVNYLAAHATALENASLICATGKLLPGLKGLLLPVYAGIGRKESSGYPTKDIRLSAMDVNPHYSIREYPKGKEMDISTR